MRKSTHFKLLIVAVLLITCTNLLAQDPVAIWDYPIKPGSEEWKSLPEFIDRLGLLNIPADKLELITTDQLVKICLDYPYFGLIFTRNSLQQGYEFIRNNFNGFRELEGRLDAARYILEEYEKMNPAGFVPESSPTEIGEYMAQFTFIELLLAQYPILNSIDEDTKARIIEETLEKFKGKAGIKSYGIVGLSTTAFVMGRIIYGLDNNFPNLTNEERLEIKELLNNCSEKRYELLEIIVKETDNYIRN